MVILCHATETRNPILVGCAIRGEKTVIYRYFQNEKISLRLFNYSLSHVYGVSVWTELETKLGTKLG
jgi:hypothetical protein